VRCFSKYDPGQRRYAAISRFLNEHRAEFFVPTEYRPQGILVNGRWFPITKTLWVEGDTLEVFIDENISKRQAIRNLLDQFQRLVATLEDLGVAHGDLQHGNILISNRKLVLIDYDGMYIRELAGLGTEERGHPDYQHPTRNREYGPDLDRFSAIVIHLTLRALLARPDLWAKYSAGGDHLIFKQKDFLKPDDSRLLRDLEGVPDLRSFVQMFRSICKADLAQVPRLSDFLSGKAVVTPSAVRVPVTQWGQYEVMAAEHRDRLLEMVGQKVTIVGRISNYYSNLTRTGQPYVFLSFGDWRQGDCRLVLWSEAIRVFQSRGKSLPAYENQWVSVTGLLTQYQKGGWPARPQIIISTPSEIEVLAGGEREARQRLSKEYAGDVYSTEGERKSSATTQWRTPSVSYSKRAQAQEHFRRGREWEQQGRWDKAAQQYQAALACDPNLAYAHNNLGWAYKRQGRLDEAIAEFEAELRINPRNALAYQNLGWSHAEEGRLDKSMQAFQAALRIDPNNPDAHYGLGFVYGQQGRLDLAIQENQTALSINPQLDYVHVSLGWAYTRQGRLDKANTEFRSAVSINPSNVLAHYNLGVNYRVQGRTQEALREFKIAAQLGYEPAKKILQQTDR